MTVKNAGMRVRVERDLREAFLDACRAEGRLGSDVLREFMRVFAQSNQAGKQQSLFTHVEGDARTEQGRER